MQSLISNFCPPCGDPVLLLLLLSPRHMVSHTLPLEVHLHFWSMEPILAEDSPHVTMQGITTHSAKSAGGRLQLNTHAPYVCGFAWSDMVHGCMVYTERAEMAAASCGTSHASAVSTPLG